MIRIQQHLHRGLVAGLLGLTLAACGGGGGGGGVAAGPIAGGGGPLPSAGLVAAVAGVSSARVSWTTLDQAGNNQSVRVLRSTSESDLFTSGTVVVSTTVNGGATLAGLPTDTDFFFGLEVADGLGGFRRQGPILRVRTGPTFFVREGADPMTADGLTAGTAFDRPIVAVLEAFLAGGGNVWITEGTYGSNNLPVFANVNVYGGFPTDFDFLGRDPDLHPTILTGNLNQPVVEVTGELATCVLDGLVIDGESTANVGISVDDTPIQLRSLVVRNCTGRGIRIRNLTNDRHDLCLTNVRSNDNGGDGLSALGAFDVSILGSTFNGNVQEGVDFDDLVGLTGEDSSLRVEACRFFGNGTEGLDVDLAAPLNPMAPGSRFDIEVLTSEFVRNGASGLLIDLDFDLIPDWSAEIEVMACDAIANGENGFSFDFDAAGDLLVHRCLARGNRGDGFGLTSETTPATAVFSTSIASGNAGYGLQASLGNVPALVSHCVLAGNALGGVRSQGVESSAASSIAFRQTQPWVGVRTAGVVASESPDTFVNAAEAWLVGTVLSGDRLTVNDASLVQPASLIEISGDGIARMVVAVEPGNVLVLDSVPDFFQGPESVALFPAGGTVVPDWQLSMTSIAVAAGIGSPASPSVDAGVFGAPDPGPAGIGADAASGLKLRSVAPALHLGVPAMDPVTLEFGGGAFDRFTATSTTVRALDAGGVELGILISTGPADLVIDPPVGGWPSGLWTLELYSGLETLTGEPLISPLVLPMSTP